MQEVKDEKEGGYIPLFCERHRVAGRNKVIESGIESILGSKSELEEITRKQQQRLDAIENSKVFKKYPKRQKENQPKRVMLTFDDESEEEEEYNGEEEKNPDEAADMRYDPNEEKLNRKNKRLVKSSARDSQSAEANIMDILSGTAFNNDDLPPVSQLNPILEQLSVMLRSTQSGGDILNNNLEPAPQAVTRSQTVPNNIQETSATQQQQKPRQKTKPKTKSTKKNAKTKAKDEVFILDPRLAKIIGISKGKTQAITSAFIEYVLKKG